MRRVIAYVDGFNLYYGLRSKGWKRYYWLDIRRMAERILRPDQELVAVRYFTARVQPRPNDPGKPLRQRTYLEALETLRDLSIHYGYFQPKRQRCSMCGATWQTYEEKMTDVNIAVEMLADAQDNAFDTAIIISGDGDLAGPVRAVSRRYPKKRVVVAFPPGRHSAGLRSAATSSFTIGRNTLRDSQLPNAVTKPDGYVLTRPPSWR